MFYRLKTLALSSVYRDVTPEEAGDILGLSLGRALNLVPGIIRLLSGWNFSVCIGDRG